MGMELTWRQPDNAGGLCQRLRSFLVVPDFRLSHGRHATHSRRVCRAWHVACGVGVPAPGKGEAEGKRKGNCVTARWGGKEAQRESTGRRTGTGYEVWYTQDQRARD